MKILLRYIVFYSFALSIVSQGVPGLVITGGISTICIAGSILAGLQLLLRPLVKVLAFPLVFFTLGLFNLVINASLLFLLTKFLPNIQVHAFTIPQIAYMHYRIPQVSLNIFFAYMILSAIIGCITKFFMWMSE